MKKVLLGTSAVALASAFASSAYAVDWEIRVGGYMEQYAAWSQPDVDGLDGDWSGIDSKQDAEIHFVPSITLDNGLKIGADVQLEGNTDSTDQIDESFLFLDGSFGRVLLGSENSAGYLMHYGAPDVTFLNVNSGSLTKFVPYSGTVTGETGGGLASLNTGDDIFRGTLGSSYVENARNNDAQRFTYFTPRFAGFQLGVSYARDGDQDNNSQQNTDCAFDAMADLAPNCAGELANIFDVGANYVNSFGGFDVAVSGRYGIATLDDEVFDEDDEFSDNPQVWAAGLNLGYMGFTIGGSFAEQNNAGAMDGQFWDAGVAYETGPWGFSFTYAKGDNVDNETGVDLDADGFNDFFAGDEELKQYLLGISYALAKGVALNAFGAYADFDEDIGDNAINPGGDDVDGWVVGTGIKISF